MDALNFAVTVILITGSGALAPGPLFFATISHGTKTGAKSGLVFSVAHTLIEFTLVMLLAVGLVTVANQPTVKLVVGVAGGISLIFFGAKQIFDSLKSKFSEPPSSGVTSRNLMLIGLTFTGLNPFFIIWWLTAGAQLIFMSFEIAALAGVVLMYACHVWMDYVWLTTIAHFAKMGTSILGLKWYKILMAVFGAFLIYFGLTFLFSSLNIA
jgi:threonine/homoserine/homoserine lactone efflux protein